jgi:hypothetical protein
VHTLKPLLASNVINQAEAWLGFTANPNGRTPFGESSGYDGTIWAGSFIDFIFHEAGLTIPSCVYPPSGLAEFNKLGRLTQRPRPGDVVFFVFPTGETFGVSHVGLVADTSRWISDGLVGTIEGHVNSGLPKSDPHVMGVFRRVRSKHEIIGFGNPTHRPGAKKSTTGQRVGLQLVSIRPGRRNKSIGLVQLALSKVTSGLGRFTPDLFDGSTQHAYARWQRQIGYANDRASGVPDPASLRLLGETTGVFKLEA